MAEGSSVMAFDTLDITKFETSKNCTPFPHSIDKIDASKCSYNDFFNKYMNRNQCVIITSIADAWECAKNWTHSGQSQINFSYIRTVIPNIDVPVANCSKDYFNSHEKIKMKFHDYLDYWSDYVQSETTEKLLYLKDWHLRKALPDYKFYKVPPFFGSDWLNEYSIDNNEDDYMFVYMGPKGTWTPFHCDVVSSFSWSTNIAGRKRWILLPPGEELKLKDKFGNYPTNIDCDLLRDKNVVHFEVTQNTGETIFVPSGWYHQVWNLEHTISVNHNWFNGCNLKLVWHTLTEHLLDVYKEISDCSDMEGFDQQCQVLLKASLGFNFNDMFNFMKHIAEKRMRCKNLQSIQFEQYTFGTNHNDFDLFQILTVLEELKQKYQFIELLKDTKLLEQEIKTSLSL